MRVLLVLAVAMLSTAAQADEAPAPPSWVSSRRRVPDVENKVDGGFVDALPLVAYDSNTGLGLGVGGHLTLNGSRADPLFAYTPYRH